MENVFNGIKRSGRNYISIHFIGVSKTVKKWVLIGFYGIFHGPDEGAFSGNPTKSVVI